MMMNYVTNPIFDKDEFIECLKIIDVEAYKVDNGVMLDVDKLFSTPCSIMQTMVHLNLKYIKRDYLELNNK